jgi:hypothetical protein
VDQRTNSRVPSRRRRILRESGAALLLLILVLLAVFGNRWRAARREVAEAVAEADRLDPGWRFEELEAQRQLPPAEENAALEVLAVKSLLPPRWPQRPQDPPAGHWSLATDILDDLPAQRRLTAGQTRQLREDLERVRPARERARKLADMPRGRYPVAWTTDVLSTPSPWLDPLLDTSGLLELDGVLRDEEGDSDGALVAARALINVGRSLGDEPFLWGPRFRSARRWRAARAIERTLAQGQPSEAALATTQGAVEREEAIPLFLLHFRGVRAFTHLFLTCVDAGDNRLSEISCMPRRGWQAALETYFNRPEAMRVHARFLRGMNEAVEIAKLPLEEQYPRYQKWREERGLVEHVGDGLTLGTRWEVVLLTGHARLRCARAALAAERYRRRQGDWPPSLATLVPRYLGDVPLDPFDGKPMRYRRTDTGALIYSVGRDGRDDGGDPTRPPNEFDPRDIVLTVWNVDRRSPPPKQPAPEGHAARR